MDSNQDELTIIGEAFEYLQTLCGDAVSSEDLEHMALTEKQQNIFNPYYEYFYLLFYIPNICLYQ